MEGGKLGIAVLHLRSMGMLPMVQKGKSMFAIDII